MAATMKAAVLHRLRERLVVVDWPRPEPGPGEVLVRVAACGVCHSDLHAVDGDWDPPPVLPLIPGHEVTGHVAALGAGVAELAVGDTVGVPWMWSACGRCESCLGGMETICTAGEATGYTRPGGYAEYLVAQAAFTARLPADAELVGLAPILCAGVTTYRGIKRTGARAGQWLAVIGIGGLGHIAVQYARSLGLRVAAVDVAPDKLDLARRIGAEVTVDAAAEDPAAALRQRIGGAHGAVVTAVSPRAFEQAVAMLRPAGTVCWIGLPGGDADAVRVSISAVTNWELSIRGANVGTRLDLGEAVDFAVRGQVRATTRTARLDEINDVLADMKAGRIVGRVVLDLR